MNGSTYLAVANSDDGVSFRLNSAIHKWNSLTSSFDFFQNISTPGAAVIRAFTISSDTYLVFTSFRDDTSGARTNSEIFKYSTSTARFALFQSIPTFGAYGVSVISFSGLCSSPSPTVEARGSP